MGKRFFGGLALLIPLLAAIIALGSCSSIHTVGQSIDLSPAQISEIRQRMRTEPVELERPVIVLSGYHSWPTMAARLRERLAGLTSGDEGDVLSIAYTFKGDFADIVPIAIRRIEAEYPSDDPERTIEVDVIGISAGGLIARAAALPLDENDARPKRLNIRRLYTLGSPHRGAILAEKIALDRAAKDMIAGSDFLNKLDAALPEIDYEIVPYAHLRDGWVGATNASPHGQDPIWTGGRVMFSHFGVSDNWMFVLDIASRLRGEEPLAGEPSPPPRD